MANLLQFIEVAEDLELAGLVWRPELGDEVSSREDRKLISILVDPHTLTPGELRSTYLWLPTVEQILLQFEARQAVLSHAGLELNDSNMFYRTVLKCSRGEIESKAESLRVSMGIALRNLLLVGHPEQLQ